MKDGGPFAQPFEYAAELRDEINELRRELLAAAGATA